MNQAPVSMVMFMDARMAAALEDRMRKLPLYSKQWGIFMSKLKKVWQWLCKQLFKKGWDGWDTDRDIRGPGLN